MPKLIFKNPNEMTGASVLLFQEDSLLLFREINKCKKCGREHFDCCYTEPGGKYEAKHSSIEQAAEDELYEETCCLFDCKYVCKRKKDNFFDIIYSDNKLSRVFMLDVPYMKNLVRDYKYNLDVLRESGANKHYLETDDVTRASMSSLRKAVFSSNDMGKVYVKDEYGKIIKLKKRTASILYVLFSEMDRTKGKTNLRVKKIKHVQTRINPKNGMIHYLI